jgi:hypothetical protein
MLCTRGVVFLLITIAGAMGGPKAVFADASMDRVFKELEPEERAHQACNLRGIDAVRRGTHLKGVDRVTTTMQGPAVFKNNIVSSNAGAVRAGHHWYMLKFTCAVTADQMKATSFDFQLGAEIPEAKWEDYGLWK